MKLLLVNGSPRAGGNSDFVQDLLRQTSSNAGLEVREVRLREQIVGACCGCSRCHDGKGVCSMSDDFSSRISALIIESDSLILISPVYQGGVTGRMKNFMDRCEVFRKGRVLKGKLCGGVAIGGYPGGGQELTLMQIQYFAHICAMRYVASWGKQRSHLGGHCIAYERGEVAKDSEGLESAKNVVTELYNLFSSLRDVTMKPGDQK